MDIYTATKALQGLPEVIQQQYRLILQVSNHCLDLAHPTEHVAGHSGSMFAIDSIVPLHFRRWSALLVSIAWLSQIFALN